LPKQENSLATDFGDSPGGMIDQDIGHSINGLRACAEKAHLLKSGKALAVNTPAARPF
jgi:hypothetical protein